MSHAPYNENEEKFLEKHEGWICPKCKTVWSPSIIQCTNSVCVAQFESYESKDTKQFLIED